MKAKFYIGLGMQLFGLIAVGLCFISGVKNAIPVTADVFITSGTLLLKADQEITTISGQLGSAVDLGSSVLTLGSKTAVNQF